MKFSRIAALAAIFAVCIPALAWADPPDDASNWSGSGEFGLANATGNTKSLNVDAKFKLAYEDDIWKDAFLAIPALTWRVFTKPTAPMKTARAARTRIIRFFMKPLPSTDSLT